jgi:phosphoesterase RecJ-like protein
MTSNQKYGSPVFTPESMAQCAELLAAPGTPVITAHRGPDGDAIGSALALWNHLAELGVHATVVMPDHYPSFLHWLPGHESVLLFEQHAVEVQTAVDAANVIFCLDYNDLSRTGALAPVLEASPAPKIMIDHHQHPQDFAAITWSDTARCSTAELIYGWIEARGEAAQISPETGACLYTGIMTDSGSFRFPSVTPGTHRIAAHLIERGVDHAVIHSRVYDTNQVDRMRLVGYALSEKLRVWPEYHAALIALSQEELKRFRYRSGDTEGLVNQALSIEGVNMAAFIHESHDGRIKLSLRSRGSFSVREVAAAHFNGGGHFNASGGAVEGVVLGDVVAQFEALLPGLAPALDYSI